MKIIDGEILKCLRVTDAGVVFDKEIEAIIDNNKFIEGAFYKVEFQSHPHQILFKCIDVPSKSLLIEVNGG